MDGVWAAVVDSTLSDAIAPDGNRMQVVVDGSAIVVAINSVTVGGYRLPADLGPSRIGFALASIGLSGFATSFDDLSVSRLDKRVALADYTDFDSLGARWHEDSQAETGVGYRADAYAIWTNVGNWTRWQRPPSEETYSEPFVTETTAFLASGDDASGSYGICFGPTSDPEGDTYYWFRVQGDGSFAVEYCEDGIYQTSVRPRTPSSRLLTGSDSNRLRVAVDGQRVAVQANGATLAIFTSSHAGPYWVGLSAGGFGVDTTPIEVHFSRFAVYRAQ